MKIEDYFFDTDPKHSHMIDSIMYAYAAQEAKLTNEYLLLHIKIKPWYIPKFIYDFLIKKLVVISRFKKHDQ